MNLFSLNFPLSIVLHVSLFFKMYKKIEVLTKPKIENSELDKLKIRNLQLENELLLAKTARSSSRHNSTSSSSQNSASSSSQSQSDDETLGVTGGITQVNFNRVLRDTITQHYPGKPIEVFSFYEKNPSFIKLLKSE